jgi:hypothetical protein
MSGSSNGISRVPPRAWIAAICSSTLARVDAEAVGLYLRTTSPSRRLAAAAFLVTTIIDAHRAASAIFGWTEPPELEDLMARARAMGEAAGQTD